MFLYSEMCWIIKRIKNVKQVQYIYCSKEQYRYQLPSGLLDVLQEHFENTDIHVTDDNYLILNTSIFYLTMYRLLDILGLLKCVIDTCALLCFNVFL